MADFVKGMRVLLPKLRALDRAAGLWLNLGKTKAIT